MTSTTAAAPIRERADTKDRESGTDADRLMDGQAATNFLLRSCHLLPPLLIEPFRSNSDIRTIRPSHQ